MLGGSFLEARVEPWVNSWVDGEQRPALPKWDLQCALQGLPHYPAPILGSSAQGLTRWSLPSYNIHRKEKKKSFTPQRWANSVLRTEYEYEYYSSSKKWPNTNTNIIRFEKITRIRIRILFGLKKSPEYEYEYYSVWKYRPNTNTNILVFEYYSNNIRIPNYSLTSAPSPLLQESGLGEPHEDRVLETKTVLGRPGDWGGRAGK